MLGKLVLQENSNGINEATLDTYRTITIRIIVGNGDTCLFKLHFEDNAKVDTHNTHQRIHYLELCGNRITNIF